MSELHKNLIKAPVLRIIFGLHFWTSLWIQLCKDANLVEDYKENNEGKKKALQGVKD